MAGGQYSHSSKQNHKQEKSRGHSINMALGGSYTWSPHFTADLKMTSHKKQPQDGRREIHHTTHGASATAAQNKHTPITPTHVAPICLPTTSCLCRPRRLRRLTSNRIDVAMPQPAKGACRPTRNDTSPTRPNASTANATPSGTFSCQQHSSTVEVGVSPCSTRKVRATEEAERKHDKKGGRGAAVRD